MTTDHRLTGFEQAYIAVRDKEKRVYTDEELKLLPDIDKHHIHSKEWQMRRATARRLVRYLRAKNKPLNILEVGCGNGWLSAQLATIKGGTVTAIDVNSIELEQAKRVFKRPNLQFICEDPFDQSLKKERFDIIIFAASVQYFESFADIIGNCLQILTADGEIHIVDTIFYTDDNVNAAIQRTKSYFQNMGFPEMADWYFHRRLSELDDFNHSILTNPNSVINKLLIKNPFYWVKIKHQL